MLDNALPGEPRCYIFHRKIILLSLNKFAGMVIAAAGLAGCGGGLESNETPVSYGSVSGSRASAATSQLSIPGFVNTYVVVRRDNLVTITSKFDSAVSHSGSNVQLLKFADAYMSFDIDGVPGQTYRLYQAAFNRQPDRAGLGYWILAAENGMPFETIAAAFAGSAEFSQLYGHTLSDESFVTQVYKNVLQRAPDEAGNTYWLGAIRSGASRAYVLNQFADSVENHRNVNPGIANGFAYEPFGQTAEADIRYPGVSYSTHDGLIFILDSFDAISTNERGTEYRAKFTLVNRSARNIDKGELKLTLSDGTTMTAPLFSYVWPDDAHSSFGAEFFTVPLGKTPVRLSYGKKVGTQADGPVMFALPLEPTYDPKVPAGFKFHAGLIWKEVVFMDHFVRDFRTAELYCRDSVLNGQTGWRLPTQNELRYMAHSMRMQRNSNTWSSTPSSPGEHYSVNLAVRSSQSVPDASTQFVTCVR